MFSVTLPPFYLRNLKPIEQEAEWISEPFWDDIKKRKSLLLLGIKYRHHCTPILSRVPVPTD